MRERRADFARTILHILCKRARAFVCVCSKCTTQHTYKTLRATHKQQQHRAHNRATSHVVVAQNVVQNVCVHVHMMLKQLWRRRSTTKCAQCARCWCEYVYGVLYTVCLYQAAAIGLIIIVGRQEERSASKGMLKICSKYWGKVSSVMPFVCTNVWISVFFSWCTSVFVNSAMQQGVASALVVFCMCINKMYVNMLETLKYPPTNMKMLMQMRHDEALHLKYCLWHFGRAEASTKFKRTTVRQCRRVVALLNIRPRSRRQRLSSIMRARCGA